MYDLASSNIYHLQSSTSSSFSHMGSQLFALMLILLSCISSQLTNTKAQNIKSVRILDLLIRDYTFKVYGTHLIRTGTLHTVNLPSNFSGIIVGTARFRCGSLRRYGAQVKEFHLGIGVSVHPCVERVMIVTQELGYNWSKIYYANYDLSGYQLVSPILGLLAYNGGSDANFSNPFEVGIEAGENPISINFKNVTRLNNVSHTRPLCASFGGGGKVALTREASPYICMAKRHGHFGLVIEKPISVELVKGKRVSQWKVAVGSSVGCGIGVLLLGLLLVAMFVRVKKKSRMEEMERRAYEEEALQVSMVGHVRAPTASGTRTTPTLEHEYSTPPH